MVDTEMVNGETTPSIDKQQSEEVAKLPAEIPAKADLLRPKKYKTSDLPLTQDQQTAIQSLLVAFKKKGGFDNYRKKIWADFDNSVCPLHPSASIILCASALTSIHPCAGV